MESQIKQSKAGWRAGFDLVESQKSKIEQSRAVKLGGEQGLTWWSHR